MASIKVGINGLGRIGRAFLKLSLQHEAVEVVAVNDLGDIQNLAYLLKYDTAYGRSGLDISVAAQELVVNGKHIRFLQEKDPTKLPWGDLQVDVVVESTGVFDSFEKSRAHLTAGAKRVVISAPVKDTPPEGLSAGTVLMSVNEELLGGYQISSNASCTTNAASPLLSILHESIGIEKALLNTTHAYTATQSIVDSPARGDFRRGRAGAQNLAPSSTGAAIATTQAITDLAGKFDGVSVRVPVVAGSLVDITFISKRNTSAEEVNRILKEASQTARWRDMFAVTEEPLVSTDIVGDTHASIADLSFTRVVDGNLVKVLAWYDNEMGYTATLLKHVIKAAGQAA